MKKSSWKLVLCLALAAVMLMCTALAAGAEVDVANVAGTSTVTVGSDGKLTVAVNNLTTGKQYALIQVKTELDGDSAAAVLTAAQQAVSGGSDPYELGETTILYIDQLPDTSGTVTFSNFLPKSMATSLFVLGGGDEPQIVGAMYVAGVSVKGRVSSYNAKNPTTVTLSNAGGASYTTTIPAESTGTTGAKTQDFEITGVPAGTYDLKVTKAGHLSYTVTGVVVGDTEVDLTTSTKAYKLMTMLCGDMNSDNRCDLSDLGVFRTDFNKTSLKNPLTDCDGNNRCDLSDLAAFRLGFNKTAPRIAY